MTEIERKPDKNQEEIDAFIQNKGGDPKSYEGQLIGQIIGTALKLMEEKHDLGALKVITRSTKEMRYAYNIFKKYAHSRCVSIFGSARTPKDHPDYIAATAFSALMAKEGWMCMTGAANGIMKAGLEGSKRGESFGLSIRLPFESGVNSLIEGDPRLISFRFFFTRKLMFMSHSDAMAAFPGGYGTLDELFEMLTLIQTGKANIIPIVLCEGTGGTYWQKWRRYTQENLLDNRWISPEDNDLYYLASCPEDAAEHIFKFYTRYHSSRYVKDNLVIRLSTPLTGPEVNQLNEEFHSLVASGKMQLTGPLPEEDDHLELTRLVFHHTRKDFGRLRKLIDAINIF